MTCRRRAQLSSTVPLALRALLSASLALMLPLCLGAQESVAEPVRFGLIADLHAHDIDSPMEGKWMTNTESRLNAFVDAMNAWAADFVIELGDFVNGWVVLGALPGDEARIPDILTWAESLYARFDGPRHHVIGNHDVYNMTKDEYLERIEASETFYSFDEGGYHFIILDVQFAEDGSAHGDTYMGVAGFLPEQEMAWLAQDLAATRAPTVVFIHQMLDQLDEAWGSLLISNQDEIRALLASDGDVIAVFQGHDHDNVHNVLDGIHYVRFEALVDQGTPPSWAAVTLDPVNRTITIDGQGEQANYRLTYPAQD